MAISNELRNMIGKVPLQPVWRIGASGRYYEDRRHWQTEPGAGVSINMSVNSAPTRIAEFSVMQNIGPHIAPEDTSVSELASLPLSWVSIGAAKTEIEAGYVNPETGEPEYERMGRYARTDYGFEGQEVHAAYASAEILLMTKIDLYLDVQGGGGLLWPPGTTTPPSIRDWVQHIINEVERNAPPAVVQDHAPTYSPTTAEGFGAGYGVNLWDAMTGVAQAAELRLYPDDEGVWHLRRPAISKANPKASFSDVPGEANTIGPIAADYAYADDMQAFIVKHEWTDAAGRQRVVRGRTGNWLIPNGGRVETRSEPTTQAGANAYAVSRLRAISSAVDTVTFTAPMMPWLRPDEPIHVTRPGRAGLYFIMDINFDIASGTMEITARKGPDS